MSSLSKKSLSLYLRNGCQRQFILTLYTDAERRLRGMPKRETPRFGLGLAGRAGYEWQDQKVGELKGLFGEASVYEGPRRGEHRPGQIPLVDVLPAMRPYEFVVEAAYRADTPTFREAIGLTDLRDSFGATLNVSELHPDIVQCLPSLACGSLMVPETEAERDPYGLGVRPDGDLFPLAPDDRRLRLRVIDVKLTSEPGAHYFAEVVYYSMTLASWLIEQGLDDLFVVVAAPAVWPGSHEASKLSRRQADWSREGHAPTGEEMASALEEDLELAPVDVYAPRLRRLLGEELPALLGRPWTDLAWHVDFRCKGCEFLGYPRRDGQGALAANPDHCQPSAEQVGHLSRIAGLTRGGGAQLRLHGVGDVAGLAARQPGDKLFDEHQGLRIKRAIYPHRARAIERNAASVIPSSGGDALMPRWPDLHVYAFFDYDLSSAITAAISLRASWREPVRYGSGLDPKTRAWTSKQDEDEVFLVEERTVEREREVLLRFLRQLRSIFREVARADEEDAESGRRDEKWPSSTYQIYLWDQAQRKHLVRIVGRHLPYILADPELRSLAWLFPPPELLQHADDATRRSPMTLVGDVVGNTVALPIAHHYRLLDVVEHFSPPGWTPPSFLYLYQEPMSDLLPAERLHEYWARIGNWQQTGERISETTRKKALALHYVVRRLEIDLKDKLSRHSAPRIVGEAPNLDGVAPHSLLWYEYGRLNAALDSLEIHSLQAMPPHEREARLKSARLTRRLDGDEAAAALADMNAALGLTLIPGPDLFLYELSARSVDVNLKPGEFNLALSPEDRFGFLDESPRSLLGDTEMGDYVKKLWRNSFGEAGLTAVTVEAIDRTRGHVALRASRDCRILEMEKTGRLDFSKNVVLDPTHHDYLTDRVKQTLRDIGDPPIAPPDQRTIEALGMSADRQPGRSPVTPAAEVLWDSQRLHDTPTGRDLEPARRKLGDYLASSDSPLDESQWRAWEDALSRRLCLLWGPPGTGKSRTLRAVVLGAALTALVERRPLRVLVTAHTYRAIDNVLLSLDRELRDLLPGGEYTLCRVQSESHQSDEDLGAQYPGVTNVVLNASRPSDEVKALVEQLEAPEGIVILGAPQQQLHNLGRSWKRPKKDATIRPWFDLVILDEASQMDVASSTLVFAKLAPGGACVLAGDDLQLPPIQSAEPPKGLEDVVGSVYNYFRRFQQIVPSSLDVNYRSNRTIVEFTRRAGYSPHLRSHSPDLRLDLLSPVPTERPADWPGDLYWSPEWARFLDPAASTVSFVYEDSLSSQVNAFEADTVAALLYCLRGRLADRLVDERDARGRTVPPSVTPYSADAFWRDAVGVVTPHKVQMAKIIARLQSTFVGDSRDAIRSAVDTVERFQGQQRDVVVASFGLGDPDLIGDEDAFLYNLNRFNVLTSRARAKVIVLITRPLLEHLSDDTRVLGESRLLKLFAESYCADPRRIEVGYLRNGQPESRVGILRHK